MPTPKLLNPCAGHALVIGRTRSGKSTLMKRFCADFKRRGMRTAVLDPMRDPAWRCDFITADPAQFLHFARTHKGYHLFSDESGSGLCKYDGAYDWLGTTSRHLGHQFWAGCHRSAQLSVTLRTQATQLFLFACAPKDADLFAEEWGVEALATAKTFGAGRFLWVQHFAEPLAGNIDFARGKFTLGKVGTGHVQKRKAG